jgi:hypothetical protein
MVDLNHEATHEVVEKTLDVVEDTIETLERIPKANLNGTTKTQQYVILGVTAVVAAAAGGAIGYRIAKKRLKLHYVEVSNREIEAARQYYAARSKRDEFADPTKLAEKAAKAEKEVEENEFSETDIYVEKVDKLAYKVEAPKKFERDLHGRKVVDGVVVEEAEPDEDDEPPPTKKGVVIKNVFTRSEDEWDYEVEVPRRTPDAPYIIHMDEFGEDDRDFTHATLTYYEEDDVLIDDREQPVEDSEATVGDKNLLRFGHGSTDPNILYVRNERLEMDFEIALHKGSYVKEVLGFIEHSDEEPNKVRKFRSDRE